jgi:hypothetical protein
MPTNAAQPQLTQLLARNKSRARDDRTGATPIGLEHTAVEIQTDKEMLISLSVKASTSSDLIYILKSQTGSPKLMCISGVSAVLNA